jgi:hypothetical protein
MWPTMNTITNVTPEQLRNAADIQEQIISLQQELTEILCSEGASAGATTRRRISARGLANIRAGARKRWAAALRVKRGSKQRQAKRKSPMSAAGKARIAAALKARWAAAKRAGRNAL